MLPIRRNGVWLFVICALVALAGAASGAEEDQTATWLRIAQDPDPMKRAGALRGVQHFDLPDEVLLAGLREGVADESAAVRKAALLQVYWLDHKDPLLLDDMEECLRDNDAELRMLAAMAIGAQGRAASSSLPLLLRALGDADPRVRLAARVACARVDDSPERHVREMAHQLLHSGDEGARLGIALALGELGPLADSAVPALVTALAEDTPLVRVSAADALGEVTTSPELAVPALAEAVFLGRDEARAGPVADVRRAALHSLVRGYGVEEPTVRETLLKTVGSGDIRVRSTAVYLLADTDVDDPRLWRGLADLAAGAEATCAVLRFCEQRGGLPKEVVEELAVTAGAAEQAAIIRALGQLDPLPDYAREILDQALRSESAEVVQAAREVMQQSGGDAAPHVPDREDLPTEDERQPHGVGTEEATDTIGHVGHGNER